MRVVLILVAMVVVIDAQTRMPASSRVLTRELNVHEPRGRCGAGQIASALAIATGTPFGVEFLPGECENDRSGERLLVEGRTIAAVLDDLVARDPRYRWEERDGVILMRPAAAWNDRTHFLEERMDSFVHDDLTSAYAWRLVQHVIRGETNWKPPSLVASDVDAVRGLFEVHLDQRPSVLDVLSEIARVHGHLLWELEYCEAQASREFAMLAFRTLVPGGPVPKPGEHLMIYSGGARGRNPCRPGADD